VVAASPLLGQTPRILAKDSRNEPNSPRLSSPKHRRAIAAPNAAWKTQRFFLLPREEGEDEGRFRTAS